MVPIKIGRSERNITPDKNASPAGRFSECSSEYASVDQPVRETLSEIRELFDEV